MTRVLITGAAGHIGKVLRQGLRGRYELLRLSDIAPLGGAAAAGEELVQADVQDFAATHASMKGIDCVVHLGGVPIEDSWEKILPINIAGTYNVFEAARQQGVKRVIFASSNHAIGFYRRGQRIDAISLDPQPLGIMLIGTQNDVAFCQPVRGVKLEASEPPQWHVPDLAALRQIARGTDAMPTREPCRR